MDKAIKCLFNKLTGKKSKCKTSRAEEVGAIGGAVGGALAGAVAG